MKKTPHNGIRDKGKALAAAGIVAVLAGAATYLLVGPNGKANRTKAKKFILKAKEKLSEDRGLASAFVAVKEAATDTKRDIGVILNRADDVLEKISKDIPAGVSAIAKRARGKK